MVSFSRTLAQQRLLFLKRSLHVRSVPQNQTRRYVRFAHNEGFDTMDAAKEYTKGGDFAAVQKMLASFSG